MFSQMETAKFISARRQQVLNQMLPGSILVLYSGVEVHQSADAYLPFEVNKNFFYLTGIQRDQMILVLDNTGEAAKETLYIPKADAFSDRWLGKRMTVEEAKEKSGIAQVRYADSFSLAMDYFLFTHELSAVYFDASRYASEDLPDYNAAKAAEFAKAHVGIPVKDCHPMLAKMRMCKDASELETMKEAISITDQGLRRVLSRLQPGMYEYQVQADFEYAIRYHGAQSVAFDTIAGSGANGTMMHYCTNHCVAEDGSLILLDLGARYQGYCADITRTYPVNGKFSERQKAVYNAVLAANRAVKEAAKPGVTLTDLNNLCKEVLAKGMIELGLITDAKDVSKYYMHGVSHHLGIDVHDVTNAQNKALMPGNVITDEPGIYIDEEALGIRIEDDLLITEDGCVCLSEEIIRTPEEIEAAMQKS